MVMHDLTAAAVEADVAWLLQSGRLVAAGLTSEVLTESRLREVFNVPFEWLESASGGRRLAPITSSRGGG
jgi:ABC-type cobalamin/Fe3+-siderophores transport system ATPase subunit